MHVQQVYHIQVVSVNTPSPTSQMNGKLPLTHLSNCQHNVPLHDQSKRVNRKMIRRRVRAAKTGDLEYGRNRERAKFTVQLEDGLVARRLRSERLVVHDAHAFCREAVLPGVNFAPN